LSTVRPEEAAHEDAHEFEVKGSVAAQRDVEVDSFWIRSISTRTNTMLSFK